MSNITLKFGLLLRNLNLTLRTPTRGIVRVREMQSVLE